MVGLSVACGVVAIVVAVLGGPLYGFVAGIIAIVLGCVAMVTGISAKKATNGAKGTPGFVCGILGAVFGLIFTIGCFACGCSDPTGSVKFGCLGGACVLQSQGAAAINELQDALGNVDWSQF